MPEPDVYLRGKFAPASEAHLNIYDFGIVLGAIITDQLRTFRHEPYRLDDHVERFYESAKYARLDVPIPREETAEATRELIRRNTKLIPAESDLGVIYFLTPGENLGYAGRAASFAPSEPTFCIHSFPLPFTAFRRLFTAGLHLVTPSTRHVPSQCLDQKIKHRSRLHWWIAEKEAQLADPNAVPLLLDLQGNLTECSGANFLMVKGGAVYSPTAANMLRGASRGAVAELCAELGIAFHERDLQVHDIINADEVFVVTTPYCMAPVSRVNGLPVRPEGEPVGGPVFCQILAAWSEKVGVDIRAQVLGSSAEESSSARTS